MLTYILFISGFSLLMFGLAALIYTVWLLAYKPSNCVVIVDTTVGQRAYIIDAKDVYDARNKFSELYGKYYPKGMLVRIFSGKENKVLPINWQGVS